MTTPNSLSPAAQAGLSAWLSSENGARMLGDPVCLAAALYAVAHHLSHDRRQLAAIATELEGHHG